MSTTTDLSPTGPSPRPAAGTDPVAAGSRPARRSWSVMPLLTRLHFYAGILVAPFLMAAAVTGLLFTVAPQLDGIVYAEELHPARVGPGLPKPLSEQVSAAVAAHPDGTFAAVLPAAAPDATTRVVFDVDGLGEKQHTVYVDPYTGQVRGQLTTWFDETPLMTWLDDLHRNLLLYDVGRAYSEMAASWLWVLVLGGLILWCNRQWRARGWHRAGRQRRGRVAATVLPDLAAAKGVRRTRGFHAATGAWLTVGLLILSATGLTWSRWAGGNFSAALDAFHAHQPDLDTALAAGATGSGHHGTGAASGPAGADAANIDTVLHTALGTGLTGPMRLTPPADASGAWTVAQIDNLWPVRLDRIAVDPNAGVVTARSDFGDWPLLAQLSKLGVAAHMGRLFGPVNQFLLAALAVGLLCVIVWGYRMWWQRRPTRADRRAPVGTAPERGAWRTLRPPLLGVGVLATAAVGWALPAFGVTLLGFLILDVAVGLARRRRRPAPVRVMLGD